MIQLKLTEGLDFMRNEFNLHDRPLADKGLISYRCKSPYGGWIMIGAKSDEDAMREALRSNSACSKDGLQVWNGTRYVPVVVSPGIAQSTKSPASL